MDWGYNSTEFCDVLGAWSPGSQVTDDDNFFISRVKPKVRFRNTATQVRQDLTDDNDKHLIAWIPVNEEEYNALPDGSYDTEVFSMWSYVTHWGNWTAPLGRVPGAFLDVAHKNGVAVSSVASIPYGTLSSTSYTSLITGYATADTDNAAAFLAYYGVDGLGYNSEFSTSSSNMKGVRSFHTALVAKMRETNPLFENIWYDGTNDYGNITFDQGLATHNDDNFGDSANVCMSLFLNYNWNNTTRLANSVSNAEALGRSPLDLYCGVNMQGGEPSGTSWPLLVDYNLSIGLWGAHSTNMFWQGRNEKGSATSVMQNTYLMRTERYFTGGTRNPANCPEVSSTMSHIADNYDFFGMSTFMTARSALSWDLSDEPFVTHFNIGNGTFFALDGTQVSDREWYNIGLQDYLPTWRWWFATSLLGRDATDVPATGLDANITWDDAYFGGSCVRIDGSTSDEYLHLFKTQYAIASGDVLTFTYKVESGVADVDVVVSAEGSESDGTSYGVLTTSQETDEDEWVTRTIAIGDDFDGKTLALIALHFTDAADISLLLGGMSLTRGSYPTPSMPTVESAEMLYNCSSGMDGKLIFSMDNDKEAGEPCYNLDVNTSYFRIYAQELGQSIQFITATTSWAALLYAIPIVGDVNNRVRLGVSAVSTDGKTESDIAWSDFLTPASYVIIDDIQIDKTTIKPGEEFTFSYVDPEHESGTWTISDPVTGETVYTATGHTINVSDGIAEIGSYNLSVEGYVDDGDGNRVAGTQTFNGYIQITGESVGALPEIYSLTANGSETSIEVTTGDAVTMAYTGRSADGSASQGVVLDEKHFGASCDDLNLVGKQSFGVAFWLKINQLASGSTQLFSVVNEGNTWPKSDWGWLWFNIDETGYVANYTFRGTDASDNDELHYNYDNTCLPVGSWVHVAMSFDYDASGNFRSDLYVNGEKQSVASWGRTTEGTSAYTTEPTYDDNVYSITSGMMLAVGGDAYDRAGIDGTIDNLVIWDGAMSADDVATAMGDLDESALPSGVLAYWSLEDAADSDNAFASTGSLTDVDAALFSYDSDVDAPVYESPSYSSGCPFLLGTAYIVETLPSWTAKKAVITDVEGTGESGSATLTYAKSGDYSVTLTLANSLGQDERTFQVITVSDDATSIASTSTDEMLTYAVDGSAYVQFAEAGDYTVTIYNAAGQAIATKSARVSTGDTMRLSLGQRGIYIVSVSKNGTMIRNIKLMNNR